MSEFENDFGEDGDEPRWFAIEGRLKVETKAALGIQLPNDTELLWVPKSQISGVNGKSLETTVYDYPFINGMRIVILELPAWMNRREKRLRFTEWRG